MRLANALSEDLLYQVKMNKPTEELTSELANYLFSLFSQVVNTDERKKSFWVNCYNSYFLLLRRSGLDKPEVYTAKAITIAGIKLSLDDIEHGILRRYRYKYSMGFMRSFFVPKHIKNLTVERLDYRIHFALNCGAKSCPPIAFYSAELIDDQLEMATLSFLEGETIDQTEAQEIHISTLFKWYWADFGGRKGIKQILNTKLGLHTEGKKLVFTPYSWEEDLNNYITFEE
jgi:hypothetical protein